MKHWEKLKETKKGPLIFIHIPRCAGGYVGNILNDHDIINNGQNVWTKKEGTSFTVIRHPVERIESFLNSKLNNIRPDYEWPIHLYSVYEDKSKSINYIIKKMSDTELLELYPHKTLRHWCKNIDVIITIDQLDKFLRFCGYDFNIKKYEKTNMSRKERGELDEISIKRLERIFKNDILIYNDVKETGHVDNLRWWRS